MGSLPSPPPPPSPENLPTAFRIYASFSSNTSPNSLEWHNPSDNTWRRTGTIPGIADDHVLKCFAMVSLANSLYIIGGRLCRKHPGDDQVEVAVRHDVLRYNVSTGEWSTCAPLRTGRFDFACTACDGRIYVAGGQSSLESARGISSAEVYDPVSDEWAPLPSMRTLRYKCVGVMWQGRFHVVGGFAAREDSDRAVPFVVERSSAEVYDVARGEWELMAGMWQLDVPPNQIVAVGDRLLSSGDCLNTWKGHVEAYDGKMNIWNILEGSHVQDLSSLIFSSSSEEQLVRLMYLTMAAIGTHMYFVAGYRFVGEEVLVRSVSVVHTFDTAATRDAWGSFEAVEEEGEKELCGHCCVVRVS